MKSSLQLSWPLQGTIPPVVYVPAQPRSGPTRQVAPSPPIPIHRSVQEEYVLTRTEIQEKYYEDSTWKMYVRIKSSRTPPPKQQRLVWPPSDWERSMPGMQGPGEDLECKTDPHKRNLERILMEDNGKHREELIFVLDI